MKFLVQIHRSMLHFAEVTVEADTEEEAQKAAVAMARNPMAQTLFVRDAWQKGSASHEIFSSSVTPVGDEQELSQVQQPHEEPNNITRSQRIEAIILFHNTICGGDDVGILPQMDLSSLLADIRHWCEKNGADFHKACDSSYQHYLEEKAETSNG